MNKSDKLKRKTKGRFLAAVCTIIHRKGKILITKRSEDRDHDPGKWECVSGRFNQHFSTVEDEIIREIQEELGKHFKCKLIAPISFYHFYRGGRKTDELIGINYICEYVGGEIKLSPEHTEYAWIKPEEAIKLDMDKLLIKDIKHFMQIKDIYLKNKTKLRENFKKSN